MIGKLLAAAFGLSSAAAGWLAAERALQPLQVPHRTLSIPTAAAEATPKASRSWAVSGPSEYIALFCPYAQLTANRLGVHPAPILAQSALETGWGKSRPADGFNMFGIKAGKAWTGSVAMAWTHEYVNGKRIRIQAPFRDYSSFAHAWWDYGAVIGGLSRYRYAIAAGRDWRGYIRGLVKGGYATDPAYEQKLVAIINRYKLSEACPP